MDSASIQDHPDKMMISIEQSKFLLFVSLINPE